MTLGGFALLVLVMFVACGTEDDPTDQPISIGAAPTGGDYIDIPADGAGPGGLAPPSNWPAACNLITDGDLRAILPQVTEITRESSDVEITAVGEGFSSVDELTVHGGSCLIRYFLLGTENDENRAVFERTLSVEIRVVGRPDVVRDNVGLDEDEGNIEGLPEEAVCVNETLGLTCRLPNVAFSLDGQFLPHFRFEGQPDDDSAAYFSEHVVPEFAKAAVSKFLPPTTE